VIIDAHHHLWKTARGDYFWLDAQANPALEPIARDFPVEDYRSLAQANGIEGSVLVQATQTVAETQWLLEQARASGGLILGVVGWVDLAAKNAPDALADLSRNRLVRGVRPMLQDIPNVDWILRAELDPALRAVIALGLTFDALIKPPHLENTFTLLTRYPDLRVVIDHGAKPGIAQGQWQPWADQMRRIAAETRACCKLSGLVTEASPQWKTGELRRYTDHLIECFGPDRLMWGSDWPVALLAADYADWLQTTRQLIGELSAAERAKVMGENAARFYRLG